MLTAYDQYLCTIHVSIYVGRIRIVVLGQARDRPHASGGTCAICIVSRGGGEERTNEV